MTPQFRTFLLLMDPPLQPEPTRTAHTLDRLLNTPSGSISILLRPLSQLRMLYSQSLSVMETQMRLFVKQFLAQTSPRLEPKSEDPIQTTQLSSTSSSLKATPMTLTSLSVSPPRTLVETFATPLPKKLRFSTQSTVSVHLLAITLHCLTTLLIHSLVTSPHMTSTETELTKPRVLPLELLTGVESRVLFLQMISNL